MRAYVEKDIPKSYKIQNIEKLPVTKIDLESMDGKIIFSNIEVLEFMDDVDWPTFRDHVELIENIEEVRVNRSLSKFQILSKAKNIERVTSK
jgi:hypothetical protein